MKRKKQKALGQSAADTDWLPKLAGWIVVSSTVVLVTVICYSVDWGEGAVKNAPEPQDVRNIAKPGPISPAEWIVAAKESKPKRTPGILLSDLLICLEEGEDSGLVELDTSEEWELFDRLMMAAHSQGGDIRLTLFREGEDVEKGPTRRYRISFDGEKIVAVIVLERYSGRWHIVGIEWPKSGQDSKSSQRNK